MHLTKFADLGLRSLMILGDTGPHGSTSPDQRRTIGELAVETAAPASHIKKVIAFLGGLGTVGSVRGRAGGVYLAEQPADIDIGAILRKLEGRNEVVNCIECPLARKDCALRQRLAEAQENFFATLDGISLADLIAQTNGPVTIGLPTKEQ